MSCQTLLHGAKTRLYIAAKSFRHGAATQNFTRHSSNTNNTALYQYTTNWVMEGTLYVENSAEAQAISTG
jgi:hypothetical protein